MSSTGRGGKREVADNYPTPSWCVHRLLESCSLPRGKWLEPAAGDGAIIRAVEECVDPRCRKLNLEQWTAVELRPVKRPMFVSPHSWFSPVDFLRWGGLSHRFDVCLANPPYSLALPFIQHALTFCDNVVMLLRLNFLGSEERSTWLRDHTPDIYILPNRPSFVNGRTDSCEYAWMHWRPETERRIGNVVVLNSTPQAVRKASNTWRLR